MARRVFFSFHYERDIWRVNQVRNSWVTKEREAAGFWDASLWEEAKKKGDAAIKRMIDEGLKQTSVTVVLIGNETANRKYVGYEIEESYKRNNGLLGIYIHKLENQRGQIDGKGNNPFNNWYVEGDNGRKVYLSSLFKTYDWKDDNGYKNFAQWVEHAAQAVRL